MRHIMAVLLSMLLPRFLRMREGRSENQIPRMRPETPYPAARSLALELIGKKKKNCQLHCIALPRTLFRASLPTFIMNEIPRLMN